MMTFYQLMSDAYDDEHGARFFATKAEAMREAKRLIAEDNYYATLHKVALPNTKKESILKLANQNGWAVIYEQIWERIRKEKAA